MNNELIKRWDENNVKFVVCLINKQQNDTGKFNADLRIFGLVKETKKVDLRGIPLNEKTIKKVKYVDVDFSFGSFESSRFEDSVFQDCIFKNVNFSKFTDYGNKFTNSIFVNCRFANSAIGYDGSIFDNCVFENCNFSKSIFIRPEFTKIFFKNCKLKGLDFNGSSFEDCIFEGLLDDIWFRGSFPLQRDNDYFGIPRKNRMKNVSFVKAELKDLTFSDDCDLSTVQINKNGKYFKLSNLNIGLKSLKEKIPKLLISEDEKREMDIFIKVYMVHSRNQNWFIINIDDIIRDYGENVAKIIIEELG